ncbi:MAG: hypothetical protein R3F21_09045 [Myxococcota bacterium]
MIDCIFILLIFFIVTTVPLSARGGRRPMPPQRHRPGEETTKVVLERPSRARCASTARSCLGDVPGRVRAGIEDETTGNVIRAHERRAAARRSSRSGRGAAGRAVTLSFNTVN